VCLALEVAQRTTRAQAPSSQSPRPVFGTSVSLSLVDFRVVDRDGRFVGGLTKDDFRVFEDDKEQTIANFSLVEIPMPRPEISSTTSGIVSDVASNAHADEGRLYLIVLDRVNPLRTPTVRALAHEFIEHHMSDVDQAALVPMEGRRDMTQDFTHDRRLLLEAVDKFEGDFGSGFADSEASLTSLVKWLSQIRGRRKTVVFISESVNGLLNTPAVDGIPGVSLGLRGFLDESARGNVTLYIVDPTGVPSGKFTGAKPVPLANVPPDFMESTQNPTRVSELAEQDVRRQGLRVLAEATGGLAFGTTSNDFDAAFTRIVEDSSSYYVLGYEPTNVPRDGKFHKVRIEANRPGLRVRARSGYQAENASAKATTSGDGIPSALTDLLKSPIDLAGLTLSVTATPFLGRGSAASVSVVVEARPSDLQFSMRDDRFNGSMNVAIVAGDPNGVTAASEHGSLTMRLSPETREAALKQGVRVLSSLDLKPGRYHLKVAAGDAGGGAISGVVQSDITVPDFSKGGLALSGIALGSVTSSRTPTSGSIEHWKQTLGMSPTTARAFMSTDELRAYTEIYDHDSRADHRIDVMTTVTRAGQTVFRRRETMLRTPSSTAHASLTTIPLRDMAAGEYVLSVEARSSLLPDQPSSRQIVFTVR
jgi:VWFA-related protein